jgi:FOG: Ankyrin repeat
MKKQLSLVLLFVSMHLHPAFNDVLLQYCHPARVVDEQKVIAQLPFIVKKNSHFDEDGDTFLYVCCKYGYSRIAQELISMGALVNERNKDGFLPIDVAAMEGYSAIVELILAQKDAKIEPNESGVTALHWAAKRGRKNVVKLLLNHGVQPDMATFEDKQTPLLWAASGGKDTPQRIRMATRESITRPPVQDYMAIVEMLIARGANVNYETGLRFTPLHWALAYYNRDIARMLIRHKANASLVSSDGLMPSAMIAKEGDTQMLAEIEMVKKQGTCSVCSKQATQKCGKCKLAYYCSAQCQKDSWAQHKSFCQEAIKFENPPVTVWGNDGSVREFSSVSQALEQTNMVLMPLK